MTDIVKIKDIPFAIRDTNSRGIVFTDQHKYSKRVKQKRLAKLAKEKDRRIDRLERNVSILDSKLNQILKKLG